MSTRSEANQIHLSLIAIGNPIVDISAEIDEKSIDHYGLKWGQTVFANDQNIGLFADLESKPDVNYVPGGSIQNSLRVASWCLNMDPINKSKYTLTMLGCVGNDPYKDKIVNALKEAGVSPLLQTREEFQTSRCGVGIFKKDRCLVPQIIASNKIGEEFVEKNMKKIMKHDTVLIEGYFLLEKYDICKKLVDEFKASKKKIISTLSAVFIVETLREKIITIANESDLIFGNMEEVENLAQEKGETQQDTLSFAHQKLSPKDRVLVTTCGNRGVWLSKYNYDENKLEYVLQAFPNFLKDSDIVDFNGAGDAFLGGFISQWMQGKDFNTCCKYGNNASGVVIKNVGCTFPKNEKI